MKRIAITSAFVFGCLVAQCFGQIQSSAETRFILSGIDGYEQVAGIVLVPAESRPVLKAVGVVTIDVEASMISVKASNAKREPVDVQKIDAVKFLILGQGKIWIDVTCIDFDRQFFDQKQFTVDIGVDPTPAPDNPDDPDDPEPNPDLPADFDGLAGKIDAIADAANLQYDARVRLAEIYATIAGRMWSRDIKRTSDSVKELNAATSQLSLGPEWSPLFDAIRADGSARPPLDFEQSIKWYKTVAAGIKG
jgi:hypothetical protein